MKNKFDKMQPSDQRVGTPLGLIEPEDADTRTPRRSHEMTMWLVCSDYFYLAFSREWTFDLIYFFLSLGP